MSGPLYVLNWILWSVGLALELMFLLARVVGDGRGSPNPVHGPGQFPTFPIALGLCAVFTAGLLLLLRCLLRKNAGAARLWVWPVSLVLYFFVTVTLAVSFPPYFDIGKSDRLSWCGLAVTAVFLVLTMPVWQDRWAQARPARAGVSLQK